ncbi:MAG: tetratricopeptide repeat protein [Hyphomicrobiaceae bacterium]
MRIGSIALLTSLVFASPGLAGSDALETCRLERDAAERLAACTAVIESPEFQATERALAFRVRGELRVMAGAIDGALADLSAALSISPDDARAYASRAQIELTKGDVDAAVTDFSAALSHTTQPAARVPLLIGRGHTLMVKALYDQAIKDLDEAIQLNPKSASAYNHRGLILRKKGDLGKAIEDYSMAIQINPVYALAYSNRGHVQEALGKREEAIADFRRALMLDASLTSASDRLKALQGASELVGESERRIALGKSLAERTCAFCHAVGEKGVSPNPKAPPFRVLSERHPALSLREPLSRGIAAPHDEMPKFELSDDEVDGMIAYINSLGG